MWEQFLDFMEKKGSSILTAVVIVAVGLIFIKLLLKLTENVLVRSKLDKTGHKFVLAVIKITLLALVVVVALSQLGVDTTSMVAMLSVCGLAISLAVQNSLANVAGGFILLFTKPFKVGDFVELDALSGTVNQINILQTELLTYDNKAITIPNGQVSAAKLTNYSRMENRLIDLHVSVDYSEDIDRVKVVLGHVFEADGRILQEPPPVVRIREFAASGVNLCVRVWVRTPEYWDVYFALQEEVKKAFDRNGICFPFPQLDVHMKQASAANEKTIS